MPALRGSHSRTRRRQAYDPAPERILTRGSQKRASRVNCPVSGTPDGRALAGCRLSLVDCLDDRADADLAIGEDVRAQATSMDQPAEHALGGEALQVGARLTQPLA
jgi:hypothetical protein